MAGEPEEIIETVAEPNSLRASLEAGFSAAESAAPEIKPATIPEPAPQTPDPESAAAKIARDEAGRFAAKPDEPKAAAAPEAKPADPATIVQPETAQKEAPQGEPILPPAAWTAASKAKWEALDPSVKAEIAKRESDMTSGLHKQAQAIKRFEQMDAAIAPHRNYLAINGLDEPTYVRSLIAADEMLRGPNPLNALAQIAGMYNIDLRQFGQPGQQAQQGQQIPQQQPQQDPRYQALEQTVVGLQQTLAQQTSFAQQTAQAQQQAQIESFAKDHLYFENVRPQMAALLRSPNLAQQAESDPLGAMKAAYDQATWATPDIRKLLISEQTAKAQEATRAEASAKANEARQASGSVTGSPTPGVIPQRQGPAPSIRESLESQFAATA
jgi:hypothetical protein